MIIACRNGWPGSIMPLHRFTSRDCLSVGTSSHHFRVWYRDQLSPWLREILLDPAARCRSYLRPNSLERMLKAHTKGHRNYAFELHKILTLEFIHRRLIELD
jgi:hypothetical protein